MELSEESANRIRVFSDISEDTEAEANGVTDYDMYDKNVFRTTARRCVYLLLVSCCVCFTLVLRIRIKFIIDMDWVEPKAELC